MTTTPKIPITNEEEWDNFDKAEAKFKIEMKEVEELEYQATICEESGNPIRAAGTIEEALQIIRKSGSSNWNPSQTERLKATLKRNFAAAKGY